MHFWTKSTWSKSSLKENFWQTAALRTPRKSHFPEFSVFSPLSFPSIFPSQYSRNLFHLLRPNKTRFALSLKAIPGLISSLQQSMCKLRIILEITTIGKVLIMLSNCEDLDAQEKRTKSTHPWNWLYCPVRIKGKFWSVFCVMCITFILCNLTTSFNQNVVVLLSFKLESLFFCCYFGWIRGWLRNKKRKGSTKIFGTKRIELYYSLTFSDWFINSFILLSSICPLFICVIRCFLE